MRHVPSGFVVPHPVSERELVQLILALRLFLVDVGIALSTRESKDLRHALVGLGVTHMSAGSKTEPGGYSEPGTAGEQFEIADTRTPVEVAGALADDGYCPVFKDWT